MRLQENISYQSLINTLLRAIELREPIENGHAIRVSKLSLIIGEKLRLDPNQLKVLKFASLLHDIGKLGVPESILFKPGRLREEEFRVIKMHPIYSYQLLKKIDWPESLLRVPEVAKKHHEYLDGSGYPEGTKDIPIETQIITVCDIFDALSSIRHYKKRREFIEILNIFKKERSSRLNPEILDLFYQIDLYQLIMIIEPNSSSESEISGLKSYTIKSLEDPNISQLFNKYYYKKYLREKTKEFLFKVRSKIE